MATSTRFRGLDGWIARLMAGGVTYYPSEEARRTCGIALHERVRPLRRVRDTIGETLVALRRISDVGPLSAIEPHTTDGGEFAAIATVTAIGKVDKQPIHYIFGFVFGDEWYDRFDGWTVDPARVDEVTAITREAVQKHVLRLGLLRARRFHYTPPPGWQPLSRGLLTEWYPLDFPRHYSCLIVPPAFPGHVQPSASMDAIFARRTINFEQARKAGEETVSINGLGGVILHEVGRYNIEGNLATEVLTVSLKDAKKYYTYLLRLETTAEWLETDRAMLFTLSKSLHAIPSMARAKVAEEMSWVID